VDSRLRAFVRDRLGIQPRDEHFYEMAFTGWSITGAPEQGQVDKEEFLGDAVLGLAISELLMLYHPHEGVGVLSASKASLVSGKTLSRKAASLGLPELLQSRGAPLPARMQDVLADVMESLIGAVYLDLGFLAVRSLIERLYRDDFPSVVLGWEQRDLKGVLQEILVRETGEMPDYRTRPADGRAFVSEVFAKGRLVGVGRGGTKKEAEVHAAEKALLSLNQWLKQFREKKPAVPRTEEVGTPVAPTPVAGEASVPEAAPSPTAADAAGPYVAVSSEPAAAPAKAPRKRRTRRGGRRVQQRRRRKSEASARTTPSESPKEPSAPATS
jgi:ribonuclease-3